MVPRDGMEKEVMKVIDMGCQREEKAWDVVSHSELREIP